MAPPLDTRHPLLAINPAPATGETAAQSFLTIKPLAPVFSSSLIATLFRLRTGAAYVFYGQSQHDRKRWDSYPDSEPLRQPQDYLSSEFPNNGRPLFISSRNADKYSQHTSSYCSRYGRQCS